MACRCQERRDAIRKAAAAKSASASVKAARFIVRTMAEDAARALNLRKNKVG